MKPVCAPFCLDSARVEADFHGAALALRKHHVENRARRVVAEELTERLLVPRNPVGIHKLKKMRRSIDRQRRFSKMRIFRDEVSRTAVDVGEIAPATARDKNLTARLCVVLQEQNPPTPLPCHSGAHQSGRAGAEHDHIELGGRCSHI